MIVLLSVAVAIASLLVLVKSSEIFIFHVTQFVRKIGVSGSFLGVSIMSIISSLPELSTAMAAGAIGQGKLGAAILLGTNIAHLFFVMGVITIFGHNTRIRCPVLSKSRFNIFFLSILPFVLMIDQSLSRLDGVFLLFFYCIYLMVVYLKEGMGRKIKKRLPSVKTSLYLIFSTLAVILSAYWLVRFTLDIKNLKIISLITLTAIPLVNSFIDLLIGIKSLSKKNIISVEDILGSSMTNYLLALGILALLFPFEISLFEFAFVVTFSLIGMGLFVYQIDRGKLDWKYGVTLLLSYISFVIIQGVAVYV